MGGLAFATGRNPLHTPRMPKTVYEAVKQQCHQVLLQCYDWVATPIEGPAKNDFGDVDVLVAAPKGDEFAGRQGLEEMARRLQAEKVIFDGGLEDSAHFAVPWPEEVVDELSGGMDQGQQEQESAESNLDTNLPGSSPKRHIQVDIRICASPSRLQWLLFKHAHGDMWNLLGSTIRSYGLTVDDTALWLRVPEIEDSDRKRARVFLSAEPAEVLTFLGLPIVEETNQKEGGGVRWYWEEPFETAEEMYWYATRCRLFSVGTSRPEPARSDNGDIVMDKNGDGDAGKSVAEDKGRLKSNDRRRMNFRPIYRVWIEEFKPHLRSQGQFLETHTSRDEITEEALTRFGVRQEYYARRKAFLLEKQRHEIGRLIKELVVPLPVVSAVSPDNHIAFMYRSCLVKAMKRVILDGDGSYGVAPPLGCDNGDGDGAGGEKVGHGNGSGNSIRDGDGMYIMDKVMEFVERWKDEVGRVAMERQTARYEKSKRGKAKAGY